MSDRNHINSKESNYIACTDKNQTYTIDLPKASEQMNKLLRGKRKKERAVCPPAAVELIQKYKSPLWVVSPLHTLSCYLAAAMFQHRAGG